MTYENVKFRKQNITVVDGYFYMMDEDSDTLLQKTSDGSTSFIYPLDTLMTNAVKSLENDGVYFWSLETSATNTLAIKRWFIDNYICKLQETITLAPDVLYDGVYHNFSSEAFSVEHYHTDLSATVSGGESTLYISDYWDSTSISGATLHIGPNTNGEYEDVVVDYTVTSGVIVTTPLEYTYDVGDEVQYYNNLWIFNNNDATDSSTGALYKFHWNGSSWDYVNRYSGGAYKDIKSATFFNVDSFTEYGSVDTLAYVKATNILFIDTESAGSSLPYYGSMVMDNIESDEATVISIYDITMYDKNIYRLQLKATYYGTTYTFSNSTYNYQLSSLNPFVTSLALEAYPGIIAANTVSTSNITATVKDQFNQPVIGRLVYFTDDDTIGSITGGTPINTDSEGKSQTVYKSGSSAREVKITATVEQV